MTGQVWDMVKGALQALKGNRRGCSRQALLKYLEANHNFAVQDKRMLAQLRLTLKRKVASGEIEKVKGSFKLPGRAKSGADVAAKQVKKTTAKKEVAVKKRPLKKGAKESVLVSVEQAESVTSETVEQEVKPRVKKAIKKTTKKAPAAKSGKKK
eukprot:GHVS01074307.1.p1 GENE.GHVS01074307.1~~GHVS01074307.1.p1  ORF type:complete len:154 (-),score=32.27 GHVS01074307.1:247-708(-)